MVQIFELFVLLGFTLVGVGFVVVILLVIRTWLKLSAGKARSTANPGRIYGPAADWSTTQQLPTSHLPDLTPPSTHHFATDLSGSYDPAGANHASIGTDSSGGYDPGGTLTVPDYTSTSHASPVSTDLWGGCGGGDAGGGGAGGSWGDAGGGGGDFGGGGGGDFGGGGGDTGGGT